MISRRFSAWRKIAALAPLLLVFVCLPGELMVRCHMDGMLRAAPCCAHEGELGDSGPAFKARDCCDREVTSGQQRVFEVPPVTDHEQISIAALTLCAVAGAVVVARDPDVDGAAKRYGPVREGPSIVLAKHAFLI